MCLGITELQLGIHWAVWLTQWVTVMMAAEKHRAAVKHVIFRTDLTTQTLFVNLEK